MGPTYLLISDMRLVQAREAIARGTDRASGRVRLEEDGVGGGLVVVQEDVAAQQTAGAALWTQEKG
jgi:hypothetical protein